MRCKMQNSRAAKDRTGRNNTAADDPGVLGSERKHGLNEAFYYS